MGKATELRDSVAWRSKKVAARLCPGCNTRGKMILLINILSFRNQDRATWYNREGIPEVRLKPRRGRFCGVVIRFKFRDLLGVEALAGDTTFPVCS